MYRYLMFSILLLFTSCSQISVKPEVGKVYKMSLYMSSGSKTGIGTLVLPRQDSYQIYIETDARIDLLTFRSCSREILVQDPSQGLSHKKFTIKYTPNEIESNGVCQSEISALNKEGSNALGFIDYEDPETTLPAESICGELTERTTGVSICSARAGLIEKIKFGVEVMARPTNCKLDKERGTEFTYAMPDGRCVIAFVEIAKPNRIHRLTLIGYQDVLIGL
jgi:hypothetical protein